MLVDAVLEHEPGKRLVAVKNVTISEEFFQGHFPGAPERIRIHEIVRHLVNHLVSGLIEGTSENARSLGVQCCEDVRLAPGRIVRFSERTGWTTKALKAVLRRLVYQSVMVMEERSGWTRKIAELFEYLMRRPDAMPDSYREETEGMPPHRAVCDYIAGMTDGFFIRSYETLIEGKLST